MFTLKPILIAILILLSWSFLAFQVPGSVYWRDASEFVVSAVSLDIAHPAGFPTYSQIANLFVQIPFGPLAWRVNLFSAFSGLCTVLLIFILALKINREIPQQKSGWIVALLSPLPLLLSQAFQRQSMTAEVYLLNFLFQGGLLFLYYRWLKNGDLRELLTGAFIAGLGLGNHASLALTLLPFLILFGFDHKKIWKSGLKFVIFGLMGLSIYSYLPIRAAHNLSLNTGSPTTFTRLWNQISDARDRELRYSPVIPAPGDSARSLIKARDLEAINKETGILPMIAGLCGLLLLAKFNLRLGCASIGVFLSNIIFFSGWDSDPWIPTFAMLGIGVSFLATYLVSLLPSVRLAQFLPVTVLVLWLFVAIKPALFSELRYQSDFELPRDLAKSSIEHILPGGVFLTESSWFLVNYMKQVEGYRDDLAIAYLPSINHPDYFVPQKFSIEGLSYNSGTGQEGDQLGNFIRVASKASELKIEPAQSINEFLKGVVQLEPDGSVVLKPGRNLSVSPQFRPSLINFLSVAMRSISEMPQIYQADSRHHYETYATVYADLLSQAGENHGAIEVLSAVCGKNLECSTLVLNNLSVYYLRAGSYAEAERVALIGLNKRSNSEGALKHNLELAREGLRTQ